VNRPDAVFIGPGAEMPRIALGTFRLPADDSGITLIHQALAAGFRHIDAATFYGNEAMVGEALATAPIARDALFVTTKVWPSQQGYEATRRAAAASLRALRTGYLDMYMLHWPVDSLLAETWRAVEDLIAAGVVRHAGVSNFARRHFRALAAFARVPAAVNQIEMNPFCYDTQRERVEGTLGYGAVVAGYRPFAKAEKLSHPVVTEVAAAHGKTAAQVLLRWQLDHGFAVVPGWAPSADLMAENLAVFDFTLTPAERALLDGLDEGLLSAAIPPEATP
jgi:diketogulonate reductase-like aldo/keto reductase